jgi:predicted CXXCH cytochrome family protein
MTRRALPLGANGQRSLGRLRPTSRVGDRRCLIDWPTKRYGGTTTMRRATDRESARRWRRRIALVAILLTAPAARAALDADDCASCHQSIAAQYAATGGHAIVLDCASCHADRRPDRVGPRHRAVARCVECHDTTVHPDRASLENPRRAQRNCLTCHDPHGSTNRQLVRSEIIWRRKILQVTFTTEAGAGPGGFTDPAAPGAGVCEVCHRDTKVYRRDGTGAPHFTDTCTLCHDHTVHFDPIANESNCQVCHADEAQRHARASGHMPLECGTCHAQVSPTPGPGHRATEACQSCHAEFATHAPPGVTPFPCTQCHDAHGSQNINLVREVLTTPAGAMVPIRFDSLLGRVDGGFASASAPGTGICEVCHTTTNHYRADGTGSPHFTDSCLPCHRHGSGFEP